MRKKCKKCKKEFIISEDYPLQDLCDECLKKRNDNVRLEFLEKSGIF